MTGVFAFGADRALHPLGTTSAPPEGYLQLPDGIRVKVGSRTMGSSDQVRRTLVQLSSVTVPASTDLASFQLATFTGGSRIGAATLEVTDAALLGPIDGDLAHGTVVSGNRNHEIVANVLPVAGSSVAVRVGSCAQWHGYTSKTLYLIQTGGAPVTGLRLSGVRN